MASPSGPRPGADNESASDFEIITRTSTPPSSPKPQSAPPDMASTIIAPAPGAGSPVTDKSTRKSKLMHLDPNVALLFVLGMVFGNLLLWFSLWLTSSTAITTASGVTKFSPSPRTFTGTFSNPGPCGSHVEIATGAIFAAPDSTPDFYWFANDTAAGNSTSTLGDTAQKHFHIVPDTFFKALEPALQDSLKNALAKVETNTWTGGRKAFVDNIPRPYVTDKQDDLIEQQNLRYISRVVLDWAYGLLNEEIRALDSDFATRLEAAVQASDKDKRPATQDQPFSVHHKLYNITIKPGAPFTEQELSKIFGEVGDSRLGPSGPGFYPAAAPRQGVHGSRPWVDDRVKISHERLAWQSLWRGDHKAKAVARRNADGGYSLFVKAS